MGSVVCTLFEGHYHYGVAALVNSLFKNGFCGCIYVGYRGELPFWVKAAIYNPKLNWEGGKTLKLVGGIELHFLPLTTNYHLTNYKPDFMLELLNGPAKGADGIFYFDPDIVIKCRWTFFEEWINYGVAIIHEITSNDMPNTHPIRKIWEEIILKLENETIRDINSYINGGFCGVSKKNIGFIKNWSKIVSYGIQYYKPDPQKFMSFNRTFPFYSIDQDALNISAMCSKEELSEIGPEGMDFIHGGWIMSHAVGTPKPWKKKYVIEFLKGNAPSLADRQYWDNVFGIINLYSKCSFVLKNMELKSTSFLGRFYRKY